MSNAATKATNLTTGATVAITIAGYHTDEIITGTFAGITNGMVRIDTLNGRKAIDLRLVRKVA